MSIINAPRTNRTHSFRQASGHDYAPRTIGNWIAVDNRELPWITIGQALENSSGKGKKVDHVMTAKEVLDRTGLDLDVKKVAVIDPDTKAEIPRMFATYYDDAEAGRWYFGAVTDKYEVVRPSAHLSIFDEVIAAVPGAGYSAAWNMREKSMMGVTIDLPQEIVVDPNGANDRTGLHLLGINSFDGSTGVLGKVVATRWFCMNQLTTSLAGAKASFSLRHTRNVAARAAQASAGMAEVMGWAKRLDVVANNLYAKGLSDSGFEALLDKLPQFELTGGETALVEERIKERRGEMLDAWRAPHNENITRTRWGALNVVAEFMEWGRTVNGSKRTGTDATRQRAIGTLVHPTITATINRALEVLTQR
jgi:hypothetical protein